MFEWYFLYFNFHTLLLAQSLGLAHLVCPLLSGLYTDQLPTSHLSSRPNSPSSPSLPFYVRCSNLFIVIMVLCRTLSSISPSFLYWGIQNWTQHTTCGLIRAEQSGSLTCWWHFQMPPKDVVWPSLLQSHIAASGLSCPPGPQGCSQHSCFTVSQPLVCAGGMGLFPVMVQGFVLPRAELHEAPASPIFPSGGGPSGWQLTHLVYQPLTLTLGGFFPSTNLLRVHCSTSFRALTL